MLFFLLVIIGLFSFRSKSSNKNPVFDGSMILSIRLSLYKLLEYFFLLFSEKLMIIKNAIIFLFLIIFRLKSRQIVMFGPRFIVILTPFNDSINHFLKISHHATFFFNFLKNLNKDQTNSIFNNHIDIFLKKVRETKLWKVDIDFSFDLRINKGNFRYMC